MRRTGFRTTTPVLLGIAAAATLGFTALSGFSKESKASGTEENLVLFAFDDHWLPLRDNVKVTLNRPERYAGNPVLTNGDGPDDPDGYGTALYGTVLHQEGKFRMWYLAWPRTSPK